MRGEGHWAINEKDKNLTFKPKGTAPRHGRRPHHLNRTRHRSNFHASRPRLRYQQMHRLSGLYSSFLRESLHWGYPRGALRWEQAGGEAHDPHYARGAGEDWEVERLYVEEDRVHGATGLPCAEQAK
jgi:hypothetical protein